MKNKTYIWISVAILGVGGYFIYKNLLKKPVRTKQENIDIIVKKGKYGDYIVYNKKNYSMKDEITLENAIDVIENL
jgi:topoisomerase IA-like protein